MGEVDTNMFEIVMTRNGTKCLEQVWKRICIVLNKIGVIFRGVSTK